jgi:hypothetical protein
LGGLFGTTVEEQMSEFKAIAVIVLVILGGLGLLVLSELVWPSSQEELQSEN